MTKNKNTSLKDSGKTPIMRTLTRLKVMAAFISVIICCQFVVDGPLGISSTFAQESVTITCDRPSAKELFPTWSQADRDAIPGPGLDESAYAQIDAKILAMYENQNLYGQGIYQEVFFVDDLKQWLRGDRQPFSKEVLERNQRMKLLQAQMKVLENNRSTFDIVKNIDVGIDYRYLTRLKQKFGWTGLADDIESAYRNAPSIPGKPVSQQIMSSIQKVTAKLKAITVEDCASKVSDQIAPPQPPHM